jgi:hypothetical protein
MSSEYDRMLRFDVEQELLKNLINKVEFLRIQEKDKTFFSGYTYVDFVKFQKNVVKELEEKLVGLYFNIFVGVRFKKFKSLDLEPCTSQSIVEAFFEEKSRKLVFVTPR